jgi:hypothetical protein
MRRTLLTTFTGLGLMALPGLAFAQFGGGGVPPCEQATTAVPWGTTDTSCVGSPQLGGTGGPGMRISEQAHKNWPNFHAKVSGHGTVAGGVDDTAPASQPRP